MAIIKPGQVGKFNGKIGELVVSKWRGVTTGRNAPRKSTKPATAKQKDQRRKFGKVNNFLKEFSDQIAVGWQSNRRRKTAMNEAVSYHLEHALKGIYPEYEMDCAKLLISRGSGKIDGGFRPVAWPAAGFSINISWTVSRSTSRITKPTDRLTVILIDEIFRSDKVVPCFYNDIAPRSDVSANIVAPAIFNNHPVHVYIFFSSEDKRLASKSEYLGMVIPGA